MISAKSNTRQYHWVVALCSVLVLAVAPAEAQGEYGPLFDKFNFQVEGSWIDISTEIRLDSEILGRGTTVNFEGALGLAGDKIISTLAFQWQIAKRHRVGVRWQDIDRGSNAQALTDIQWGDEIIPIDAEINLGFDITQAFVDYAYYPWVKERWAAGFGLGFRWMDLQATLAWTVKVPPGKAAATPRGPARCPTSTSSIGACFPTIGAS